MKRFWAGANAQTKLDKACGGVSLLQSDPKSGVSHQTPELPPKMAVQSNKIYQRREATWLISALQRG